MDNFARIRDLLGEDKAEAIAAVQVVIVGLGGVGSYAAEALARSGVGKMTLIDNDLIETSNINRQLIALESTLGQPKAEIMAQRLRDINSGIIINTHIQRINEANQADLLVSGPDFVLDAIDDVAAKIALISYCQSHGLEIISSMGTANRLNPEALQVSVMQATHSCPLAQKMRKLLRARQVSLDFPVVFSTEATAHHPGQHAGEHLGTMTFVPGTAGLYMAAAVVRKIITGKYTY